MPANFSDQLRLWSQLVQAALQPGPIVPFEQLLLVRDLQGRFARSFDPPEGIIPRLGAVLVLLYPDGDDLRLPLTVRSEHLSSLAGMPRGAWRRSTAADCVGHAFVVLYSAEQFSNYASGCVLRTSASFSAKRRRGKRRDYCYAARAARPGQCGDRTVAATWDGSDRTVFCDWRPKSVGRDGGGAERVCCANAASASNTSPELDLETVTMYSLTIFRRIIP